MGLETYWFGTKEVTVVRRRASRAQSFVFEGTWKTGLNHESCSEHDERHGSQKRLSR